MGLRSLGGEDTLEKEMETHSITLAGKSDMTSQLNKSCLYTKDVCAPSFCCKHSLSLLSDLVLVSDLLKFNISVQKKNIPALSLVMRSDGVYPWGVLAHGAAALVRCGQQLPGSLSPLSTPGTAGGLAVLARGSVLCSPGLAASAGWVRVTSCS